MADVLARFAPENAALLAKRDALQAQIDDWYRKGGAHDGAAQRGFLAVQTSLAWRTIKA